MIIYLFKIFHFSLIFSDQVSLVNIFLFSSFHFSQFFDKVNYLSKLYVFIYANNFFLHIYVLPPLSLEPSCESYGYAVSLRITSRPSFHVSWTMLNTFSIELWVKEEPYLYIFLTDSFYIVEKYFECRQSKLCLGFGTVLAQKQDLTLHLWLT